MDQPKRRQSITTMDEENKGLDQDLENRDESNNDGERDTSNSEEGGGGDDTPKVKIGDEEYTTEELAKIVGKGKQYDELLPDYTKKSQRLAELEKTKTSKDGEQDEENVPIYARKGWAPKTWGELQEALLAASRDGATNALKELEKREAEMTQLQDSVSAFFADIQKSDKDFDEADFSEYVLKHTEGKDDITVGDLKVLYSVYKDMNAAVRLGEEKAMRRRGTDDHVNTEGNDGGNGNGPNLGSFRGSGSSIRDIAHNALRSIQGE